MEENNKNEKEFSVDINKEELKNQTKETVNQVKETIKNADFKDEATKTKGFILELISNPVTTIKSIVNEEENRFSNAIILMICFIVTALVDYIISVISYKYTKFDIKSAVLYVISPIIYVLAFAISTYLLSGKNKKNVTTILSGIIVGTTPYILINVVNIISIIVGKVISIGFVFSMFTSALRFSAYGLLLYAIKGLINSNGDEDKDFRKVIVIAFVAYVIIFVMSKLGIYSSI